MLRHRKESQSPFAFFLLPLFIKSGGTVLRMAQTTMRRGLPCLLTFGQVIIMPKLICHFNFQFSFSSRTGEMLKYDLLCLFQGDLHFVDQNSNTATMKKLLLYSKSSLVTPPQMFIKCALLIIQPPVNPVKIRYQSNAYRCSRSLHNIWQVSLSRQCQYHIMTYSVNRQHFGSLHGK